MACTAWPKRNCLRRKTQQMIAITGPSEAAERTTLRSRADSCPSFRRGRRLDTAVWASRPSGGCYLRPVAGARRATPRRIHGVRLAIAATARSERRIAVRGPGVGVDTSSASADPAGGP